MLVILFVPSFIVSVLLIRLAMISRQRRLCQSHQQRLLLQAIHGME
jgi:hypothetical protein